MKRIYTSPDQALHRSELLIAIPEYQVGLLGGERPTHTDVFALAGNTAGLSALAIEGKVDEAFGLTVAAACDEGAEDRLAFLRKLLELDHATTGGIRYELLHRTAAAIVLA